MPTVVLCTAGYDHTIRFWEATTATSHRAVQFSDSQVNSLKVTADKQLLAATGNPHVRLYDVNGQQQNPTMSFEGHTANVTAVGFHRDRKWMFTGAEDLSVRIWDLRAPTAQREYKQKAPVNSVALHPNQGELFIADEDGTLRVWDLAANQCSMEVVPDGKVPLRSISIAPDASLLSVCNNRGSAFVYRLGAKKALEAPQRIDAHASHCLKCVLSPDAKLLATTSSDRTVKIWQADKNFALHKTLAGHQRWVWDCEFSADSAYIVTASSDKTARLWDIGTGATILEYAGAHSKALTCVALNDTSE